MSFRESRSNPKLLLLFIGAGFLAAIVCGLWVINYTRWENALETKLAELEAEGIATSLREIDRRYHDHDFDPAENAASLYNRAFAEMSLDDEANIVLGDLLALDRPDPGELAMRDVLAANEVAIALLKKGSTRAYLRFDLDFTEGVGLLIPHIGQIRQGVRLLAGEAMIAAESGVPAQAGDAIVAALRIAIHLREEPGLIQWLTVTAIENIGRIALERVLAEADLTSQTLQEIEHSLRELEDDLRLMRAINAELTFGISIYGLIRSDVKVIEEILGSGTRNAMGILAFQLYLLSGLMTQDELGYVERMEEYLRIAERPASERAVIRILFPDFSENPLKAEWIQSWIVPSVDGVFEMDLLTTAYRRATLIALAAERHRLSTGNFPADLEELVPDWIDALPADPYSPDGAFQWIREETGVSIRSQGTAKLPGAATGPVEFSLPLRER